jgi:antibiotic biosynthesis monooxygenase (ABM) superfamily enzyme
MKDQGATVVINHHIIDGKQHQYENWLNEIGPICRSYVGNIDWQIVRPIPNLTFDYTVIIRFDTIENLTKWIESDERKNLIKKAQSLFSKDDKYLIKSGLDFLFSNNNEKQKVPARWKQYLITWSAIYPLSVLIPLLVLPTLKILNFPENRFINSLFISGVVVLIMIYLLMPNYTKLVRKWLYK